MASDISFDHLIPAYNPGEAPSGLSFDHLIPQNQQLAAPPALLVDQRNFNAGIGRGLQSPFEQGARIATHGIADVTGHGRSVAEMVDQYTKNQEEAYKKLFPNGPPSFDLPRAIGESIPGTALALGVPGAGAASLGGRLLSGAASGALAGALQPQAEFSWPQTAENAGLGALGGVGGSAMANATGRAIEGATRPQVQTMMEAGVRPTPGAIMGGLGNDIEQKASSIFPTINFARRGAVEDFDRGAANRALGNIGEKINPKTPVGREMIDEMQTKIGNAYNGLLSQPGMNWQADPTFMNNIHAILNNTPLLPERLTQLNSILKNQFGKIPPGTMVANGRMYKEIESEIGRESIRRKSDSSVDVRDLGQVLFQIKNEMRDTLRRQNPQYADELGKIDAAYADAERVGGASASLGAKQGVFSPAQLSGAVKAQDPSLRKKAFQRGEARMQDLSDAGQAILGNTVPDSGTAGRAFLALAATGGLGGAAHAAHVPESGKIGLGLLASQAASMGLYSTPGRILMAHLLASRPGFAGPLAGAVRRGAGLPLAVGGGGTAATLYGQ